METEKKEPRKTVPLSDRMKVLAELVTRGNTVADVGCDHGFLSIYLVQTGISPKVIASDVRTGPLDAAREHIAEYGLEDQIETRLSDGLMEYWPGEAQTLLCAGMGGRLMQQILTQSEPVVRELEELILQPQSELFQFRVFLREQGYTIEQERIVCEDGKYYFAFRVVRREASALGDEAVSCGGRLGGFDGRLGGVDQRDQTRRLYDKFGEKLLKEKNPVLKEYLEKRLAEAKGIREEILSNRGENPSSRLNESLAESEESVEDIETALAMYFS